MITNDNNRCAVALTALQDVIDPEIGLNVVDLGLIYQIDFDDVDSAIHITMTLTTKFCPMGESISEAVKRVVQNSFPAMRLQLNITFDPHWSNEMISAKGKIFLNSGALE